ncbi:hypothetical protein [Adonisia turfae]|uniref:Uncharacterized protein n=1 Tax=Adonisia turfae CCMR0081 TaxID=2292702 RepID=A0A6M0RYP4_9CYAN|nr:hypothetical protein [Adonisia turfae]NEZ61040.1 hypothetical protein [Adonisia turfae CCMR0081]
MEDNNSLQTRDSKTTYDQSARPPAKQPDFDLPARQPSRVPSRGGRSLQKLSSTTFLVEAGVLLHDYLTDEDRENATQLTAQEQETRTPYYQQKQEAAESRIRNADYDGRERPSDRKIEARVNARRESIIREETAALISKAADESENHALWVKNIQLAQVVAKQVENDKFVVEVAGDRYLYEMGRRTAGKDLRSMDPLYHPEEMLRIEQDTIRSMYVLGFEPSEIRESMKDLSPQARILSEGSWFSRNDQQFYVDEITQDFDNFHIRQSLNEDRAKLEQWRIDHYVPLNDRRTPQEYLLAEARQTASLAEKLPEAELNSQREFQRLLIKEIDNNNLDILREDFTIRDEYTLSRSIGRTMYAAGFNEREVTDAATDKFPPIAAWNEGNKQQWADSLAEDLTSERTQTWRQMVDSYRAQYNIPSSIRRMDRLDAYVDTQRQRLAAPEHDDHSSQSTEPILDEGLYDDY